MTIYVSINLFIYLAAIYLDLCIYEVFLGNGIRGKFKNMEISMNSKNKTKNLCDHQCGNVNPNFDFK